PFTLEGFRFCAEGLHTQSIPEINGFFANAKFYMRVNGETRVITCQGKARGQVLRAAGPCIPEKFSARVHSLTAPNKICL
ncbi:MAG: hypothetical protein P8173_14185, partial [Gammaproteobacteria bacterium]